MLSNRTDPARVILYSGTHEPESEPELVHSFIRLGTDRLAPERDRHRPKLGGSRDPK